MRKIVFILLFVVMAADLQAQYVYTIKADSVKITNCDSAELILENHTQNVPGFLFNNGNGRTSFKRAAQKLNDSSYLFGADTVKIPSNAWLQGGNSFGATGVLGTLDNNTLDFITNGGDRMNIFNSGNVAIGTTTDAGYKFNVNGTANISGLLQTITGISTYGPLNFGNFNTPNLIFANNLTFNTNNALGNTGTTVYTFTNQTPVAFSGSSFYRLIDVDKVVNRGAGNSGEETAIRVDFNVISGGTTDLRAFHAASGNIIVGTGNIQVGDSTGSTSKIDVTGTNGFSQFRLRTQYTPTSSSDPNGNPGDTAVDDNYFYYKTSTGWKRVALSTF